MKRFLLSVCLLSLGLLFNATAADKAGKNPLLSSDTIIWAGLDYSTVRMIGPGQFRDPEAIVPQMFEKWNELFLRERLRFVERETRKRVLTDIGGVTEANKTAKTSQVIAAPGPDDTIDKSHISDQDIVNAVKSYKLENKSGPAAVFIVDRLVKTGKKGEGAVYVVGFDAASRDIFFKQRQVHNAAGAGFRNYWFRVIKDSERALGKMR